jgi:hypothetical protein
MRRGSKSQYTGSAAAATGPVSVELIVSNPKLKLMDQVKEVMRLRHYSIRTEQCYCDWIRRYVKFHRMRMREDLGSGAVKVGMLLSDLAVNGHVSASTQNQAFNALLFLYREILRQPFENVQAVRAKIAHCFQPEGSLRAG